jgi:hypothetical protein
MRRPNPPDRTGQLLPCTIKHLQVEHSMDTALRMIQVTPPTVPSTPIPSPHQERVHSIGLCRCTWPSRCRQSAAPLRRHYQSRRDKNVR